MRAAYVIHRPLHNMFAVISDVQYAAVSEDGFHPCHWRGLDFPVPGTPSLAIATDG